MKRACAAVLCLVALQAWGFGGGFAQVPYLIRLITENVKRYHQLKEVIRQNREGDAYLRTINRGIDNAVGVILTLPVEDQAVLEDLKTFKETITALEELYGAIPKGPTSPMFKLHDETVAESVGLINDLKEYVRRQERNAEAVFRQAPNAAPKGAVRMAAVTNSQILHAVSQLIKINGQMLKLQSEAFGMENRRGKGEVEHFNRINEELGKGVVPGGYVGGGGLPRF